MRNLLKKGSVFPHRRLLLGSCCSRRLFRPRWSKRWSRCGDGTRLLTLILMPQGSPAREGWPSVLQRTPYNARGYLVEGFADQGFVSIAQDMCEGIIWARFREGLDKEVFMEEGRVYPVTVDLWSVSYVFNRGHRMRLAISSSSFPRYEPNPNTGKPHWKSDNPPSTQPIRYFSSRTAPPIFWST